MDIREEEGRLVLVDEQNQEMGEVSWVKTENVLVIDHTFIEPELSGKGYGRKLIQALSDKARSEKLELLPICPYAKKVLIEPEYEDLLRK